MKVINKIIALLAALLLLSVSVFAEETFYYSGDVSLDLKTGEATIKGRDIITEKDFSSTLIRVFQIMNDGETIEIYTGSLGGYDGGRWKNVDFSNNKPLMICDWQTKNCYWVVQIQSEENSASTMKLEGNLMPASSDLAIASQIKLNGVNVGENGIRIVDDASMVCSLTVSNNSNTDKEINAFLATYTETGRFHNVSVFSVDVDAGETVNTEFSYQFDAENEYTGKIMFWDSMTTMLPLRLSVDFSQTSGVNAYYYDADNRLLQVDKMNGTSILYTYDNMGNLLTRTTRK